MEESQKEEEIQRARDQRTQTIGREAFIRRYFIVSAAIYLIFWPWNLPFSISFRTLTDIYLRKEASSENKSKPKSGFTGWISGWFSKNTDDDTLEIPYLNVKVGDNEWKEIYEAIQYQEKEDTGGANKPPSDWVQIQADFMLGVASATLQNDKGEPIANVAFEALQLGLLLRDKWTSVSTICLLEWRD